MKVKHSVISTQDEVDTLFNTAMTACLTVYPTVEEQTAAILAAKIAFKTQLDLYFKDVFKVAKKIAVKKADTKDTSMYIQP